MALAALCARYQAQGSKPTVDFPDIKFQAFVVDHGVRDGSDREADSVSRKLGLRG